MGKIGGERNFGYGKQMAWAGKNALADRYGDGHYDVQGSTSVAGGRIPGATGTQAAHGDRWQQFCECAREQDMRDMRQEAPAGMERLQQATSKLREQGEDRVAVVAELAREFGLRFREASLLDARTALNQSTEKGAVNITEGTKGGRGHIVDRRDHMATLACRPLSMAD